MAVRLGFDRGTITVDGRDASAVPDTTVDDRTGTIRAPAHRYRSIRSSLEATSPDVAVEDGVLDFSQFFDPVPALEPDEDVTLRPYQRTALDRWLADRRGVVVLPTGAGKTIVGMAAIDAVGDPVLVVVPTLDLVDQWIEELRAFDVEIGELTGRRKELCPITVTTYDSALSQSERIGNRFGTVVFDEVHHLAAEGYRHIARALPAPARLGLTATFERADGAHEILDELIGGPVFEIETEELTGEYLSEYTLERISVDLLPEEREEYERKAGIFRDYLRSSNITMRGPSDYRKVVMRSGNDPDAWRAVRARNEARRIAYGSAAKLDALAGVLDRHRDDRVIVFTESNDLVYRVSDRFLVAPITHRTGAEERRRTLRRFREGRYSAIVSSHVLDEGVDVPDANVGVILSGSGSTREYRQRLGRILRPSGDVARLYEIVARDTGEIRTSNRRKG